MPAHLDLRQLQLQALLWQLQLWCQHAGKLHLQPAALRSDTMGSVKQARQVHTPFFTFQHMQRGGSVVIQAGALQAAPGSPRLSILPQLAPWAAQRRAC